MEPYRLALWEDDPRERDNLTKLCRAFLDAQGIPGTLEVFPNTVELEEALEEAPGRYDLLLLDIQMQGRTGMEFAKELRARGDQVRILFLTGAAEYALEGYEVGPIHFLLKPVDPKALERVLLSDWKRHHQTKTVLFRNGNRQFPLGVEEILYMESLNRSLVVHTEDRAYTFPMTLAQGELLVPPGSFARCHNSFLVNLSKVEELSRTTVRMRGGAELPMGRKFAHDFQVALVRAINR